MKQNEKNNSKALDSYRQSALNNIDKGFHINFILIFYMYTRYMYIYVYVPVYAHTHTQTTLNIIYSIGFYLHFFDCW